MNPTNTSPPHKTQTQPTMAHRTTHRRNLAPPHQDPATSSTEPTRKKHPKPSTLLRRDSDPNLQTIMRPFSKLYTTHQNAAVSHKDSIFLPKTRIETGFQAKPVSVSAIENKPMSKLSHLSRKTFLEIEKQKLKSPNFVPKPQIETSFQVKPVSLSAIEEKAVSKSGHKSRKTIAEIEKQKLRASVTGVFDKPHDFKIGFLSESKGELKKLTKKDMGKVGTNVSLSKSQDSGLKVGDKTQGGEVKRPSFSLSVTVGGRRSFCHSQAELADFLSCNGVKIVSVDMPPYMQIHAVNCARKTCDSLEKFTSKTLAFTLKKEFDGVYGPAWHCIVGSSFGSFVTHSVGGFMYFSMDHKIYILLFKTTVQRAD